MSFRIVDLRLDRQEAGEFITNPSPVVSWRMEMEKTGAAQVAYRIEARDENGVLLWDTGKVQSSASVDLAWAGEPLRSRQRGKWRVTAWEAGGEKVTSPWQPFEVTLLERRDWKAIWIRFEGNNPSHTAPCPYFRRQFSLPAGVVRGRLYISARGLFEAHLNGHRVGGDRFVPGWVDFHRQIPFLTYDVTSLLQEGQNVLGVILGEGWYCGYIGRRRNIYGRLPELLAQLEVTLEDGTTRRIATDRSWRCRTGPLLASDIYDGEFYDSRLELAGWDMPGGKLQDWHPAISGQPAADTPLTPRISTPMRQVATITSAKLLHPRHDLWIWDLGQNITGNVRVRLRARGLYTFRFAEMLNEDGTLYTLNYRSAISTDHFYCNDEDSIYEPTFTFHGFRYVQIDCFQFANLPVEKIQVTGIVLSADLEPTGTFRCGHEKLNRLYQNVVWGQRGNFLDVPVDCPQRDERLGWTGDAEIFAGTACRNFDSANFFRKYLRDVRETQLPDGQISSICPDILKRSYGAAGWADAATILPWTVWSRYGDTRVIRENLAMMEKWVAFQRRTSDHLVRPASHYGDWLALSKVETPSELIGTAYFRHGARLLGEMCSAIGESAKAARYHRLSEQVSAAFRARFVGKDGLLTVHSQTALALALHFRMLTAEQLSPNAALLARLVHENGDRLSTGFIGTACLTAALSENGQAETAYNLYLQEAFPSWLFPVNQGATTMWERWNSFTLKDGFGDPRMNSFNHYAYGAIHEWVVDTVCGLRLDSPAGKKLRFACLPDARLGFAEATLQTPYGLAKSAWRIKKDGALQWDIAAPPNTTLTVVPPTGWKVTAGQAGELPCGKYRLTLRAEEN